MTSWEQFQRNQEQIRANRTSELGPARGLRMMASYNNAGHTARYNCNGGHTSYDAPYCQTLKAAPVDMQVHAPDPEGAGAGGDRGQLGRGPRFGGRAQSSRRSLGQRPERARRQVDQGRRRYASVEPENRLVARILEQDWETALGEQAHVLVEHERFVHERPAAPTSAELAAIQDLTKDLPALWRVETTTRQERQTIARLLLERVIVTVIGGSEQVRLECHWHGGNRTSHRVVRPVAKLKALSTYPDLVARVCELHRAGRNCVVIAATLNQEGWRPPKRRDTFNGPMVRRVLIGARLIEAKRGTPRAVPHRCPDEWTINELAAEIGTPLATIYNWSRRDD